MSLTGRQRHKDQHHKDRLGVISLPGAEFDAVNGNTV